MFWWDRPKTWPSEAKPEFLRIDSRMSSVERGKVGNRYLKYVVIRYFRREPVG